MRSWVSGVPLIVAQNMALKVHPKAPLEPQASEIKKTITVYYGYITAGGHFQFENIWCQKGPSKDDPQNDQKVPKTNTLENQFYITNLLRLYYGILRNCRFLIIRMPLS